MGFLPADRKNNGGIMELSARENLTLPHLRPFWSRLRVNKKKEVVETTKWFGRLSVRPANGIQNSLVSFSGGNQQKILFGKWMRCGPAVFLLDEPTQGVDVGAKAQLHLQLLELAKQGTAIMISSTDIEELEALCNRVLIFRSGRISDELRGARINASEIKQVCMSETTLATLRTGA